MDQPRPEVTVSDPRRPGRLVPVEEPAAPRLGRRGAALLAAGALAAAAALTAADVARDRRAAVEQRRLDGVVDVGLGGLRGSWSWSHDARTGTGTVEGRVRLHNRGPRDVRVTAARLGALGLGDEQALPAGEVGEVRLSRTVRCPEDGRPPPPEPAAERLRLALETPAGPRRLVLDTDGVVAGSLDESVQRACLHPPLRESLRLSATVVRLEDGVAVLQVSAANEGLTPVRLLSLVPARGLVVESIDGGTTGLPLLLPVRSGRAPLVSTVELRLGVICGALLGADLLRPFEELSAIVEDEQRSQLTSVETLSRDPQLLLRQLARRTCSSG